MINYGLMIPMMIQGILLHKKQLSDHGGEHPRLYIIINSVQNKKLEISKGGCLTDSLTLAGVYCAYMNTYTYELHLFTLFIN